MSFLLQKLVSRLLFPVPLVVMMQVAALVALLLRRRRIAVTFSAGALALLGTLSSAPIADALLWNLERRHQPLEIETIATITQLPAPAPEAPVGELTAGPAAPTAIVVLGSAHSERPELSGLHALSTAGTARVAEAVRLAAALPNLPLWFTGGVVEGNLVISEIAAAAAVDLGAAPERITTDAHSRNTREEAALVAQRLAACLTVVPGTPAAEGAPASNAPAAEGAPAGPPPVILVTSASHMPRAVALFAAEGVQVIPAPTDYRALGPPYALWSLLPSVGALHNSERAWYEYLGSAWARLQRQ